VLLGGGVWTFYGPLQPGWNAIANNAQGSGSRLQATGTQAASGTSSSVTASFTATLQGTASQSGPDGAGNVTIDVPATLSSGAQGNLDVRIQGQLMADGSIAVSTTQVTLTQPGAATRYQGQTSNFQSHNGQWQLTVVLQGNNQAAPGLQAQIGLRQTTGNQMQGTVDVTPASA
jgi:hypothetical protein